LSSQYLGDAGFTGRVLERLPPARQSLRAPLLLGFALASGALGVGLVLGPASGMVAAIARFSLYDPLSIGAVAALAATLAASIYAAAEEAA
jgi:hypothetical protein